MCYNPPVSRGTFYFHPRSFCHMATNKLIKTIKEKFTPNIVHEVHRQGTWLTILWVSSALICFGITLGLFCMYTRILMLEQAIRVLAS